MENEKVKIERRGSMKKGDPARPGCGRPKIFQEEVKISFKTEKKEFEKFQKVCKLRDFSYAKVLRKFMAEYVEKYCENNPEKVEEVLGISEGKEV